METHPLYGNTVGVFMENQSDKCIKGIHVGFTIKKGGLIDLSWLSASEGSEVEPHEGPNHSLGSGHSWFHSHLCGHLVDGRLTIEVWIRQVNKSLKFIPENPFAKSMLKLFMDEDTSDVVIEAGGEPVRNTLARRRRAHQQVALLLQGFMPTASFSNSVLPH